MTELQISAPAEQYVIPAQAGMLDEWEVAAHGVTAYINAGGRGTRLNQLFEPDPVHGVAKALLEVGEKPIALVEHAINTMRRIGIRTVVAGAGDHEAVARHVADVYSGTQGIHTVVDNEQFGNGGDLVKSVREHSDLFGDHILVTNVDTIVDVPFMDMMRQHRETEADLTIAVTLNDDVPNQDAFHMSRRHKVVHSAETTLKPINRKAAKQTMYRASSTGAMIIKREVLQSFPWIPDQGPLSLYRDVMRHVLKRGKMFAFNNGHRLFIDIGTVSTWNQIHEDLSLIEPHMSYHESNGSTTQ